MLKKLVCFISGLFLLIGCATIQPKSDMYLPNCKPGEVIFIINTHENAWIEIAKGYNVRRIDLRMVDDDCIMQQFSPPLFGYFTPGIKELKAFNLWKGVWIPSKDNPEKGTYRYTHIATFEGKTEQGIYNTAAEFIKKILVKEKR